MQRVLGGLAVVLALAGFLWWAFVPAPVAVETAPVTTGTFTATIEEDGRTRVRERYIVSAPVGGRIERLALKAGDPVQAGQVVATLRAGLPQLLDPRTQRELEERLGALEAAFEEASAARAKAQVLLDKAQADRERTRQLRASGIASAVQLQNDTAALEAARRDLTMAGHRLDAAEHARAQARAALNRAQEGNGDQITLTAPVAGHVLRVVQESEAAVAPGAALVEIGDPRTLEIAVDLLTTDAVRVREGAMVSIERWGGAEALKGRVRRIEPSGFTKVSALGVEEQRVWVIIDLLAGPAAATGLGDGFRVEVSISVDQIDNALLVPVGALFRRDESWCAYVNTNGRADLRRLEVRQRSGKLAAVAAGLAPGERVILYPPSSVTEGVRLREHAR